ncbi:CPBP family intramembrane glutamic endopeptidase [Halomicroarcula sp. GCM10025324]|uniref:CPBP family intramembrane glutamic endopeptidase n=1 Tax=Halomicroarcula sp. GCM10025324 TaxID=3252667 RepID=UPI0036216652
MQLISRDSRIVSDLSEPDALVRAGWFVGLTLVLSLAIYIPVIASAHGWIGVAVPPGLSALAIFTPAVVAIVLHVYDNGIGGLRTAFRPLITWRFGLRWWTVVLGLAPVMLGLKHAAYLSLGGALKPAPAAQLDGPLGLAIVPIALLVTLFLSMGEELGWRGYLLPLLQTRFGAAIASFVLGVCWFAWHIPLQFVPGDANSGFPLPLWGLSIVATAFVYTWLFNNTGGSVLAVTLFHGLFNTLGPFIALHPSVTGNPLSAYVLAGVNVTFAVIILALYGTASFTRPQKTGVTSAGGSNRTCRS